MPQRPSATTRDKWPDSGAHRELLELFDRVRESEGRKSLAEIAKLAHLGKGRVSEIFTGTGSAKPRDEQQVELLVRAMGGGDDEVAKAKKLFRDALAEEGGQLARDAARVSFVPRAGSAFVRRESLLERYRQVKAAGHAVVVLAGLPGAGKTALAGYLASGAGPATGRHWMIRCGTEWDLVQSLRPIVPATGRGSLGTHVQVVDAFRKHLLNRKPPLRTLVFDDIRDGDQLRHLLPDGVPGDFIVTSRRRLPEIDASAQIDVGPMTEHESQALVAMLTGEIAPSDAAALAAVAADNPLAIEAICGAFRQDDEADPQRFARELRADVAALLDQPHDDGRPGLTTTYRKICDRLREDDPLAYRLLGLIAFAASGPLETAILLTALRNGGTRPIRGLQVARAVAKRCLVRLRQTYLIHVAADSRTGVEMHELTRLLLREILVSQKPACVAELHDGILGLMAEHLRVTRTKTDVVALFPQLLHFGRHLLPGASRESGQPVIESPLDGFSQYLEVAARLLAAIGADPGDYYLFCVPSGQDSYALGIGIVGPGLRPGDRGFKVSLDTADLIAWAPEGNGELVVRKRSVRCSGPDGPTRMYGIVATFP